MIIDLILDRQDGFGYSPKEFYDEVSEYGEDGWEIARALDSGTEQDIKKALCDYVVDNDYNADICDYINSVKWLEDEPSKRTFNMYIPESKRLKKNRLTERGDYTEACFRAKSIVRGLKKDFDTNTIRLAFQSVLDEEKMTESKKSVRRLKEGPGAGYDVTLENLPIDFNGLKILSRTDNSIEFEIPIKEGYVDKWSAADYYNSVSSDGLYYDDILVMEYDEEDRKIEGGAFHGFITEDYFSYLADYDGDEDISFEEQWKVQEDTVRKMSDEEVISAILDSNFEHHSGFDEIEKKLTVGYGGGWSHAYLNEEMFTLEGGQYGLTDAYEGIIIDKVDIIAPNIAKDINWFFENDYRLDEIFFGDGDEEDEEEYEDEEDY